MSGAEYRLAAERLIAFWQGREDSSWCRSLAGRMEQTLRSPVSRSGADLRTDPESLERALAATAAVDPVTRELVRKLAPPPSDGPRQAVPQVEPRSSGWQSARPTGNSVPPPQVLPQTVIHAERNTGIVAGRDIHGGIVFQPPAMMPAASVPEEERRTTPTQKEVIRILFMGANPHGTAPLRLDHEVREIEAGMRQAKLRDEFEFRQQWSVRVGDLQNAILHHEPQILHFSGHGEREDGLYFEDNFGGAMPVSGEVLAETFSLFSDSIRCIVLNACHSRWQAEAMAESIDCVIGMSKAIGDDAAIRFSTAFYRTLAFGKSVQMAFKLGCNEIRLQGLNEQHTPQLIALRRDPSEVVFAHKT